MELRDAMRSMHACRFFTPDPVPDAVFHQAVEAARGVEKSAQLGFTNIPKALDEGDHFAEHFGEHPAIVVVCMDRNEIPRHIAVGYPERPFPTRLRRRPVEELAFVDSFGSSLTV